MVVAMDYKDAISKAKLQIVFDALDPTYYSIVGDLYFEIGEDETGSAYKVAHDFLKGNRPDIDISMRSLKMAAKGDDVEFMKIMVEIGRVIANNYKAGVVSDGYAVTKNTKGNYVLRATRWNKINSEIITVEDLKNKVIDRIELLPKDELIKDEIIFYTNENEMYCMYHEQYCCESVTIEDIVGDLDDLIGVPITMAEEATNKDNPKNEYTESCTWTFYKLATSKGYVTIRWYGHSNGYYSERVNFERIL